VFDASSGKIEMKVRDLVSGEVSLVTSDPRPLNPVWSPDGTQIAYSGLKAGAPAIYLRPSNTVGVEQERWKPKDGLASVTDWTPNGKSLVLSERPFGTNLGRLSLLNVTGKEDPVPLIEVPGATVGWGRVSPDGKWIAYDSNESGRDEVYISSFPKPVGQLQISGSGGTQPRWRNDGKELYYLAPDKKLMAATLGHSDGSVQVLSTRMLFQTAVELEMYDAAPDGNHFVVDSTASDESLAPLNLVINWTAELKKK
jgi:Tol biopolymer transport system component